MLIEYKTSIKCIVLLIFIKSCFGLSEGFDYSESIDLQIRYKCASIGEGTFNISGTISGEFHYLNSFSCNTKEWQFEKFSLQRSDTLLYYIEWFQLEGNFEGENIVQIKDSYNVSILQRNIHKEKTMIVPFSLNFPIHFNDIIMFTNFTESDSWYKRSYTPKDWDTIQMGNITDTQNTDFYYRYSFSYEPSLKCSGLTFVLQFLGSINIYLNDNSLITLYNDNATLENIKLIFPCSLLTENNLVAIYVNTTSLEIPVTTYINTQLYYHLNTYEDDCSYTLPEHSIQSTPSISSLENLVDNNLYTAIYTFSNNTFEIMILLEDNTYYSFNRYILFPTSYISSFPSAYILEGSMDPSSLPYEDRTWTIIDESYNNVYPQYNKSVYLYTKPLFYRAFRLTLLKTSGSDSFELYEFYPLTCMHKSQSFMYSYTQTISMAYKIETELKPLFYGYFNVTLTPELPDGLSYDPVNGFISGIPKQMIKDYTITATALYPYYQTTSFILVIQPCMTSHILVRRQYGSMTSANEGYSIVNSHKGSVIVEEQPNTFDDSKPTLHEYCVDNGDYTINMIHSDSRKTLWRTDSYLTVYLVIDSINYEVEDYTKYNIIFNDHLSTYSSSKSLSFSTKYLFPIYTTYKYIQINDATPVPSQWTSINFDDSLWSLYNTQKDTIDSSIFYLYRISFEIKDIMDAKNKNYNLYMNYLSGVYIYLNEQLIFTNNCEGPFSATDKCKSYSELLYRRITLQGKYLKEGVNILSIALIPDVSSISYSSYSFITVIQDQGRAEFDAFSSVNSEVPYYSLFDHNYDSHYYFYNNSTIIFKSENDEYSQLTHYALSVQSNTVQLASTWILQGRVHSLLSTLSDEDDWKNLDERNVFKLKDTISRNVFYIKTENQGLYNEYRFKYIYPNYDNTADITQVELYTGFYNITIPSLEYPTKVNNIMIDLYMNQLKPIHSEYYYDFVSNPSLPSGITLNKDTGNIQGIIHDIPKESEFTIQAYGINHEIYSTILYFSYLTCSTNNTVFYISIQYNNKYRDGDIYLKEDKNKLGPYAFSTYSILENYPIRQDPTEDHMQSVLYTLCIPRTTYTLELNNHKEPAFVYPSSYSVYNKDKTFVYSSSMKSIDDTEQKSIYLTPIIAPYVSIWSFKTMHTYDLSFLSATYDISSWSKMYDIHINGNKSPFIMFRTYFDLTDLYSHSSLDIDIQASGSIELYVNHVLMIHEDYDNNEIHNSRATIKIQGNRVKNNKNILAVVLKGYPTFEEATLIVNILYKNGECTRYLNQFTYSTETPLLQNTTLDNSFDYLFNTYTLFNSKNPRIDFVFNDYNTIYFNSLFYQVHNDSFPFMLFVYGKQHISDPWVDLLRYEPLFPDPLSSNFVDIPKGIVHFKYIRLEFQTEETSSVLQLSQLSFAYCNYQTQLCPSVDGYPSVGEYLTSYKPCTDEYSGYMSRFCDGFDLSDEDTSLCIELPPKNLHYSNSTMIITAYEPFVSIYPIYDNIIRYYRISPVPAQFIGLNSTNGQFTGLYTGETSYTEEYTITGHNSQGTVSVNITVIYQNGMCEAIDDYPTTYLFAYSYKSCEFGQIGQIKRLCTLESTRIVWGDSINECIDIWPFAIIIGLIIIVVILIIIVRIKIHADKKNREIIRKLAYTKIIRNDSHQHTDETFI